MRFDGGPSVIPLILTPGEASWGERAAERARAKRDASAKQSAHVRRASPNSVLGPQPPNVVGALPVCARPAYPRGPLVEYARFLRLDVGQVTRTFLARAARAKHKTD